MSALAPCCGRCGCTDETPCVSPDGVACHWVVAPSFNTAGLCSACATAEDFALAEVIRAGLRWERPAPRWHQTYPAKEAR
jgi:hypothetical protein